MGDDVTYMLRIEEEHIVVIISNYRTLAFHLCMEGHLKLCLQSSIPLTFFAKCDSEIIVNKRLYYFAF